MRRRSIPKADPGHVARRKAFLAEQYVFNGNHASIKKTITWDDLSETAKGARVSTSQTPGLSDKSYTPTPAGRPLPSALKSSNGSRIGLVGSQSRLLPSVKKEVVLRAPDVQPSTPGPSARPAPRLPKKSTPAARRAIADTDSASNETQQLDSAETRSARVHPETIIIEDDEAVDENLAVPTANQAEPVVPSPRRPLFNPGSDDERDAREDNSPLIRSALAPHASASRSSPPSSPDLGAAAPPSPPPDEPALAPSPPRSPRPAMDGTVDTPIVIPSTSSHARASAVPTPNTQSPPPNAGPSRQKRRRSSVGIQTVPEREVDWLGDMQIDESMSAIDVSRVWVGASSPARSQAGGAIAGDFVAREDEGEPMGTSFLEEFEGPRSREEPEHDAAPRTESVGPFSDAVEGVSQEVMTDNTRPSGVPILEQNSRARRNSSSPEPIHVPDQPQSARSSPDPVSFDHYAGMTEDMLQPSENATLPTGSKTQTEDPRQASRSQPVNPEAVPYPFNLRPEGTSTRTTQSQPARSRSRMYTPMPTPSQPLRAAPTLGRSLYDELNLGGNKVEGKKETESSHALRAAPTLGRSMDWDLPAKNGAANEAKTNETPKIALIDDVEEENPFHESGRPQLASPSPSPPPQAAGKPRTGSVSKTSRPVSESQPQPYTPHHRLSSEGQPLPSASQPEASTSHSLARARDIEEEISGSPKRLGSIPRTDELPGIPEEEPINEREVEDQDPTGMPEAEGDYAPSELPMLESRSPSSKSRGESAVAKSAADTDYDAEYGSVPPAISEPESHPPTHVTISSSPPRPECWTLEPSHASTPQFKAKLPPSTVPILHIDSPPRPRKAPEVRRPNLEPSPDRPKSLVALGKRRRESVVPQPPSKKFRREYDTVESSAMARDTRAHEDKFDEAGNRVWVPPRPAMQRAPGAPGSRKITQPVRKGVEAESSGSEREDRNEALPEALTDQQDTVIEGVAMQQIQGAEPPQGLIEDDFTEIPETPQVGPVRNLEPHSELYWPVAGPSKPLLAGAPPVEVERPTPASQDMSQIPVVPSREQSRASPFISFASTRPRTSRSKRRSEQSGLQFTPGPRASRTRLSLGGRSGPIIEEASERDARILQEAGLKPTLKRLSQAHGFTTEVVADVYQEHGDLKETEEALKEMKRSASRTRARIARRSSVRDSMVPVNPFSSQEREGPSSSEDEQTGNVLGELDTTRSTRDILFGSRR